MTTKEQLLEIANLGRKDIQAKEFKEKLESILTMINSIEDLSINSLNNKQILELEKKQLDSERQRLNLEIQTEKSNLRKWEQRAGGIRGEREYSVLITEIAMQKKMISHLETNVLENYEKQDVLAVKLKLVSQELEKNEIIRKEELEKKSAEISSLRNELQKINSSRELIMSKLPETILAKYNQIAAKRSGIAIAFIRENVCLACNQILPYELCNQIAKNELLENCPNCRRFLVQ